MDGEYQKVTVTQETGEDWWDNTIYYVYRLHDGTTIARSSGDRTSPSFTGIEGDVLYLASIDENQNIYTYTYTDKKNVTHTIGTSTGANELPTEFQLYERYIKETVTRIKALENAVTTFSDNVAKKAACADGDISTTDDNINHRIAVVGFASGGDYRGTNYDYGNTEVFVGDKQYKYGTRAQSVYSKAFQDMNTTQGQSNVSASINALDANGGTLIDLGVEMANGILNANPIPAGEKRNKVIVVFTDGQPGWSGYDSNTAQNAITEAKIAKDSGVTVYTVGIFDGADATSAGSNVSNETKDKSNWFMQNLSSNNGVVQNPSYYLSAADADTLTNIFKQISDQIESGGSSTTLGEETVIKDIISPQFKLPEGATTSNITLETSACTGIDENGEYTWSNNLNNMGATASIIDNEISVTGFDFSANYVGTVTQNGVQTYRGNKLVISFDVVPKPGFLGGNNVFTNTSASVYENADATDPVLIFERPQVNVPINDVTVTTTNKNVYLYNGITKEEVLSGSAVKCGNVALNIFEDNFGLQSWQTEYVDIDVVVSDGNGNKITNITNLSEDQVYTVSVLVKPKSGGAGADGSPAVAKSKNSNVVVNVFKPVVTFKDTHVFYGEAVPNTDNYSTENYVSTTWQHGSSPNVVKDTEVTMLGTAPTLNFEYTPDSKKFVDGKINSKEDIGVDVATKINGLDITQYVTYAHKKCEGKTCPKENFEFLLHVDTGILTINKSDGTQGEPYVFTVLKDGTKYTETTIVCDSDGKGTATIKELPAGNYTVVEDTNWSWRYSVPTITYSSPNTFATLSSTKPKDTVSVTNIRKSQNWLNGFSTVVQNIFGKANN